MTNEKFENVITHTIFPAHKKQGTLLLKEDCKVFIAFNTKFVLKPNGGNTTLVYSTLNT